MLGLIKTIPSYVVYAHTMSANLPSVDRCLAWMLNLIWNAQFCDMGRFLTSCLASNHRGALVLWRVWIAEHTASRLGRVCVLKRSMAWVNSIVPHTKLQVWTQTLPLSCAMMYPADVLNILVYVCVFSSVSLQFCNWRYIIIPAICSWRNLPPGQDSQNLQLCMLTPTSVGLFNSAKV